MVFIPDAGRCYVAVVKTVVGKAKRLGNRERPQIFSIQLHPHRHVSVPGLWVKTQVSSSDGGHKSISDHSVPVSITAEDPSSSRSIISESYPIVTIHYSVTCHPLVSVLATLDCGSHDARTSAEVNL